MLSKYLLNERAYEWMTSGLFDSQASAILGRLLIHFISMSMKIMLSEACGCWGQPGYKLWRPRHWEAITWRFQVEGEKGRLRVPPLENCVLYLRLDYEFLGGRYGEFFLDVSLNWWLHLKWRVRFHWWQQLCSDISFLSNRRCPETGYHATPRTE